MTDNLTGLIWPEEGSVCIGLKSWTDALAAANGLYDCPPGDLSCDDCGLADGSLPGQWRLPNIRELQSLVHYGFIIPALPNTAGTAKWVAGDPFSTVAFQVHWTSTTTASNLTKAWSVDMSDGEVNPSLAKTETLWVWPVRGGQ